MRGQTPGCPPLLLRRSQQGFAPNFAKHFQIFSKNCCPPRTGTYSRPPARSPPRGAFKLLPLPADAAPAPTAPRLPPTGRP